MNSFLLEVISAEQAAVEIIRGAGFRCFGVHMRGLLVALLTEGGHHVRHDIFQMVYAAAAADSRLATLN